MIRTTEFSSTVSKLQSRSRRRRATGGSGGPKMSSFPPSPAALKPVTPERFAVRRGIGAANLPRGGERRAGRASEHDKSCREDHAKEENRAPVHGGSDLSQSLQLLAQRIHLRGE